MKNREMPPDVRLARLNMTRRALFYCVRSKGYSISYNQIILAISNWQSVMPKTRIAIETTLDELEGKNNG